MTMNQPSDDQSSSSDTVENQYVNKRSSQQASQSRLSLGVIAGLLLVIPIAIILRKGYISQQDTSPGQPPEEPLEPVQMIKNVPTIVVARKMLPDSEEEADMLHNAFGDPIGTAFDYLLPGERKISIPRAGFEELLLSDLKADEIPADQFYILDRLYFASGSSELNDESLDQIKATAAILQAYPVLRIQLRGHTDNSGSEEINLELSKERAHSVMVALIKQGVLPMRLSILGMGSQEAVADNDTEDGKQRNRRIDLSIFQSAEYGPSVYSY
jgi:outer membrane protein OmpA-like peptidoglycan-associated protein